MNEKKIKDLKISSFIFSFLILSSLVASIVVVAVALDDRSPFLIRVIGGIVETLIGLNPRREFVLRELGKEMAEEAGKLKRAMIDTTIEAISYEIFRIVTLPLDVIKIRFQVMASKTKVYIVLEFVTGGELFDKISYRGRLKEDEAQKYFQLLISNVDYCHSRGVYHRDLKPENLLLDASGTLKVLDFGLSALPH